MLVVSTALFTSIHLLNFDKQRNICNFTTVHICIKYRAVGLLTLAVLKKKRLLKRKIYNTDYVRALILQITKSRKHKTLQLHIQGCPIIPFDM